MIHFPFETNGKLMVLGVPILKHFKVNCGVILHIQSTLTILNIDISKYSFVLKNILYTYFFHFSSHFNSFYPKPLISLSKFSGTRKFTLGYQ